MKDLFFDEPGREHAEKLAQSLVKHGCKVKVATLPGLPPKGKSIVEFDSLIELVETREQWSYSELRTAIMKKTGKVSRTAGLSGQERAVKERY